MLSGEDINDNLEINEQLILDDKNNANINIIDKRGNAEIGNNNITANNNNNNNYMEFTKDSTARNNMCFSNDFSGYTATMNLCMFGDDVPSSSSSSSSYETMYFDGYDDRNPIIPSTLDNLNPLPTPQYDFDAEMLGDGSGNGLGYGTDDPMAVNYRGTPNAAAMPGPPLSSLMSAGPEYYSHPYTMQGHSFSSSSSSSSSSLQLPGGEMPTQQGCSSSATISPVIPVMVPSASPLTEAGTRARNSKSSNNTAIAAAAAAGKGSPGQNCTSSGHVVRKYTQRAPRGPESSAMAALDPAVKEFRREKNKRAAREFRDRQKKLLNDLTTRVKDLETERDGLAIRLQYMENEVKLYKEQINDYRTAMLKFTVSTASQSQMQQTPQTQIMPQPQLQSQPNSQIQTSTLM